jgi:NAD(P)H-quinone oxidoreductase subunit 5
LAILTAGSFVSLAGAVLALVLTVAEGSRTASLLPLFDGNTPVLGIYLDRLSAVMLGVVSVIGTVVLRYSVRYLDGDSGQLKFLTWLGITISSVQLLILSSNLGMFFVAWVAVSLSLHKLLIFFDDRQNALACARKKFLISRIGDVALLVAIILTYRAFGTLDFASLFESIRTNPEYKYTPTHHIIALFFALGSLTKSAQLPFHSWLPDSLETPTPVSALMHAGIINAGGFLLIRLSPFFEHAPLACNLLALIGGITALFGMSVMVSQTSIKKRLAYSTVGQMGFMIMQCGLGLYHLALLHIVAHAFYKAYAFLRAGGAMEQAHQQLFFPKRSNTTGYSGVALVTLLLVVIFLVMGWEVIRLETNPAYFPILTVWALASTHLFVGATTVSEGRSKAIFVALIIILLMISAYLVLSRAMLVYLGSISPSNDSVHLSAIITISILFCVGFFLHISRNLVGDSALGRRLFVHLHNGFYLGTIFDRFTAFAWGRFQARSNMERAL